MTLTESLIAELTQEAATTRRVLERVPEDRLTWAPHPKSRTLGQLALHVAQVPGLLADFLSELTRGRPPFDSPEAVSRVELLSELDRSVAAATAKLAAWGDEGLMAEWKMVQGEKTILALPRMGMVRAIMLNHWYHHRGQLAVYLRLLDVPVPSVYGPSADEDPFN
jgi:uncharacterized damage-inducible protein DinB